MEKTLTSERRDRCGRNGEDDKKENDKKNKVLSLSRLPERSIHHTSPNRCERERKSEGCREGIALPTYLRDRSTCRGRE